MAEERVEVISENIFVSLMHEGKLHLLIQDIDSTMERSEDIELKDSRRRRNSTGNLNIPYTRVKILSRYLAASNGSCHDHCKYGFKQTKETKSQIPLLKRIPEADGQDRKKAMGLAEGKKKSAVIDMASLDSKIQKSDGLAVTKRWFTDKKIVMSKQLSYPPRGPIVSTNKGSNKKLEDKLIRLSTLGAEGCSSSKYVGQKELIRVNVLGVSSGLQQTELRRSEAKQTSSQDKERVLELATILSPAVKKVVGKTNVSLSHGQSTEGESCMKSENVKSHKVGAEQSSSEETVKRTLHVIETSVVAKTPRQKKEKGEESTGSSSSHSDKSLESGKKGKDTALLVSPSKGILRQARKRNLATQSTSSSNNKSLRRTKVESGFTRPSWPSMLYADTKSHTGNGGKIGTMDKASPVCFNRPSRPSLSSIASPKSIPSAISSECDGTEIRNKAVDTCVDTRSRTGKGGKTGTMDKASPVGFSRPSRPSMSSLVSPKYTPSPTSSECDGTEIRNKAMDTYADTRFCTGKGRKTGTMVEGSPVGFSRHSRPSMSSLASPKSTPSATSSECDETELRNKAVDIYVDTRSRSRKGGKIGTMDKASPVGFSRPSQPSMSSLASPNSTPSATSSEYDETEIKNKAVDTCVDSRSRTGEGGKTGTIDKASPVGKLKFLARKPSEVMSEIHNPRRLKLRQRVLGDSPKGKVDNIKENLKIVEVEDVEVHGSETEPRKVVLRHQDVQGIKVGQSSLNNMIEETASKLVQAKKSKVKALVSAFETVISLHDSKSASTTNEH